jgi:hypothetical protein
MQKLLSSLCVLAFAVPALCQQPAGAPLPDAPGWTRTETVKPGTRLHVSATDHSVNCQFTSADDSSITCAGTGTTVFTYQRTDVRRITSPRRGWSALIGLGIGVGAGAIVGAALGSSCTPQSFICFGRGSLAAVFAAPLGVIGAGIGALTDFDRRTVYKAP